MKLNIEVQRLLLSFAQRRRTLLFVRGALVSTTTLVGGTVLATVLDATLMLEDQPRRITSFLLVLVILAAAWSRAGKSLTQVSSSRLLATLLEKASPPLSGSLLSAVELGSAPDKGLDSPEFRQVLQDQTGKTASALSAASLLPWSVLKRDAQLASVSIGLLLLSFTLDGARFGVRCARILFPFADFQRPSDTAITLISPAENNAIAAADDELNVVAQIIGPTRSAPYLEYANLANGIQRSPMRQNETDLFDAKLPIGSEPLWFRIHAGSALTRKIRVTPKPRPTVVSITRIYHPPTYSSLPERTVSSAEGGIAGLEGTWVDLTIQSDQPLSGGSLRVSGSLERALPVILPLTCAGTSTSTRFQIKDNGSYTVCLIDAVTGFASTPGNTYEIRSEPDSPPSVALDMPTSDVTLPLGDKLTFSGHVEDDLGIASVFQEVQLNKGPWTALQAIERPGKQYDFQHLWDPLSSHPKSGDLLSSRFVAFDTKGQRGESRVVQIALVTPQFLPKEPASLAAQRTVSKQLELATKQAQLAAKALSEAKAETEARAQNTVKRDQAFTRSRQALDAAVDHTEAARKAALGRLRNSPTAAEQSEIALQIKALDRLEFGQLKPALKTLDSIDSNPGTEKQTQPDSEPLRNAAELVARAASLLRTVQVAASTQLDRTEASALAPAHSALAAEFSAPSTPSPEDNSAAQEQKEPTAHIQEALRKQQVNQAASASLQSDLRALTERSPTAASALKPSSIALQTAQNTAQSALAEALASTSSPADSKASEAASSAQEAAGKLGSALEKTRTALESVQPALREAAAQAQRKLQNEVQSNAASLAQTARELDALTNRKQLSPESRRLEATAKLQAAAAVLRADAELESARLSAAPQTARDLLAAAVALESQGEQAAPFEGAAKQLKAAAKALDALEAIAAIHEAKTLAEDATREAVTPSPPDKHSAPELKDLVAAKTSALPEQLQKAGLASDAVAAANDAKAAAAAADTQPARQQIIDALNSAAHAANADAKQAREQLDALAPSLSSRMQALADKASDAAKVTSQLAQSTTSNTPSILKDALKAEASFAEKSEQLRKELQALASTQETLRAEGRENARDADDAAALLKDSNGALKSLQQANASKADAAPLLKKAADQQAQNSARLTQLAEHFNNAQSENKEALLQSRKALRDTEHQTGSREVLTKRQAQSEELAAMATALQEQSKTPAEASQQPAPDQTPQPGDSTSRQWMQRAQQAAKDGDAAKSAAAIKSAAEAQQAENRLARSTEDAGKNRSQRTPSSLSDNGSPMAENSNSNDLPAGASRTGKAWGALPQKLAHDLTEGRKETSPTEYRSAIDAYFQAIAERARSGNSKP
jgi:hypothetical protein